MKWFGPSWHAPVNVTCEQTDVPVGSACFRCGVPLVVGDVGFVLPYSDPDHHDYIEVAYHRHCLLAMIGVAE